MIAGTDLDEKVYPGEFRVAVVDRNPTDCLDMWHERWTCPYFPKCPYALRRTVEVYIFEDARSAVLIPISAYQPQRERILVSGVADILE